jgi:hypothetical protein
MIVGQQEMMLGWRFFLIDWLSGKSDLHAERTGSNTKSAITT